MIDVENLLVGAAGATVVAIAGYPILQFLSLEAPKPTPQLWRLSLELALSVVSFSRFKKLFFNCLLPETLSCHRGSGPQPVSPQQMAASSCS
jgi:hypothetical protein